MINVMIWNVRSVNNKRAFERLITIHRQHQFQFIGLMEPMKQSKKLDKYRRKIGFAQAIINVSNKIWAFIHEKYDVTLLTDSIQTADSKVV